VRILIVDDDACVLESLEQALLHEGHEVITAADGLAAWELFLLDRPDFAVLDISMAGLDGIALTQRIVAAGEPHVPILLVSGRSQELDKVLALDAGADDYMVKPFGPRELLARIRAIWRRTGSSFRHLTVGNLAIDPATHKFYVDGRQIDVTSNEFALVHTLMTRAGQVVRHGTLMRIIWGMEVSSDMLRVTVYRLRRKIEPNPHRPHYISTVPGIGYLLQLPSRHPVDVAPPASSDKHS
jgi:DNA-binding response OmpR family regulator